MSRTYERAIALIVEGYGLGKEAALWKLKTDAVTRSMSDATIKVVAGLIDEVDRLKNALSDIQLATYRGRVCDDVAWFDPAANETLFDFVDRILDPSGEAALRDMFVTPTHGAKLNPEYARLNPRQKWGALAVNGLLGTDEPWIEDMDQALRDQEETIARITAERDTIAATAEASLNAVEAEIDRVVRSITPDADQEAPLSPDGTGRFSMIFGGHAERGGSISTSEDPRYSLGEGVTVSFPGGARIEAGDEPPLPPGYVSLGSPEMRPTPIEPTSPGTINTGPEIPGDDREVEI